MPNIRYLQDNNGEIFYPMTHERGVCDSNGVRLTTKLGQTDAIIENLGNLMATINATVGAINSYSMTVSWDGDSVPVVGNIPDGVVVEYNNVEYTGTMEASASTLNTTYLVGEEGSSSKTQYITVDAGDGNYIWLDYGTTDIDLSDYQRKDDEIWLTETEFAAIPIKDPTKTYNVYEEVYEL